MNPAESTLVVKPEVDLTDCTVFTDDGHSLIDSEAPPTLCGLR